MALGDIQKVCQSPKVVAKKMIKCDIEWKGSDPKRKVPFSKECRFESRNLITLRAIITMFHGHFDRIAHLYDMFSVKNMYISVKVYGPEICIKCQLIFG